MPHHSAEHQALRPMEAHEALAVRQQLGLTPDALAAELSIPPGAVTDWENGKIKVPKHIAEKLRWRGAVAERNAALEASGLPECEWVKAWSAEPQPKKLKDRSAHLQRMIDHEKACPVCQRRAQFIDERFGPMPPAPMPMWVKGISRVAERVEKLPPWARPAAWMSLVFGAYTLIRVVFMLPTLVRDPREWLTAAAALALSMSLGAIVGLGYGGFRAWRAK